MKNCWAKNEEPKIKLKNYKELTNLMTLRKLEFIHLF